MIVVMVFNISYLFTELDFLANKYHINGILNNSSKEQFFSQNLHSIILLDGFIYFANIAVLEQKIIKTEMVYFNIAEHGQMLET